MATLGGQHGGSSHRDDASPPLAHYADLIRLVMGRLPTSALADASVARSDWRDIAEVLLAERYVEAEFEPAGGGVDCATALTVARVHREQTAAATHLAKLLRRGKQLQRLVVDAPLFHEDDVIKIVQAMASVGGLVHVELTSARMSTTASPALATSLTALPHVQSLVLAGNKLGDAGLERLQPGLECLTALRALDLSHNGLTAACLPMLTGVAATCTALVELELSGNKLAAPGRTAYELAGALRGLAHLEALRIADIGVADFQAMQGVLAHFKNLKALDASAPRLPREIGKIEVLYSLLSDLPSPGELTSLRLWSDEPYSCLTSTLEQLLVRAPQLRHLAVCALGAPVLGVARALVHLQDLTELHLHCFRHSRPSINAACLLDVLPKLPKLQVLEVRSLFGAGAVAALPSLTALTKLDLDFMGSGNESERLPGPTSGIAALQHLRSACLHVGNLDEEVQVSLLHGLRYTASLTELELHADGLHALLQTSGPVPAALRGLRVLRLQVEERAAREALGVALGVRALERFDLIVSESRCMVVDPSEPLPLEVGPGLAVRGPEAHGRAARLQPGTVRSGGGPPRPPWPGGLRMLSQSTLRVLHIQLALMAAREQKALASALAEMGRGQLVDLQLGRLRQPSDLVHRGAGDADGAAAEQPGEGGRSNRSVQLGDVIGDLRGLQVLRLWCRSDHSFICRPPVEAPLKVLAFEEMYMDRDCTAALAATLAPLTGLQALELAGLRLTLDALGSFVTALAAVTGLTRLDLEFFRCLFDKDDPEDLGMVWGFGDEVTPSICGALRGLLGLQELCAAHCRLGPREQLGLAEAMKGHSRLVRLDLRGNHQMSPDEEERMRKRLIACEHGWQTVLLW